MLEAIAGGGLGKRWREYQEALRADARALVVDPDQTSRALLAQLLAGEGYGVDTASSLAETTRLMGKRSYELLVIEKTLPDGSGLAFIERLRQNGDDTPAVLCMPFPTVAGMSKAISLGASDCLPKPFPELSRLLTRLQSILEYSLTERLYRLISQDIAAAISSSPPTAQEIRDIEDRLLQFKRSLEGRSATLLVEDNAGVAEVAQDALASAGLHVEAVTSIDIAMQRLRDKDAPLSVVVSLKLPGSVDLVSKARAHDPFLEIVVATYSDDIAPALEALDAGASDVFCRFSESMDALKVRVLRAFSTSKRRRLHIHLVKTLLALAKALDISADEIVSLAPKAHRASVKAGGRGEIARPVFMQALSLPADFGDRSCVDPAPSTASIDRDFLDSGSSFERRGDIRHPCLLGAVLKPWGTSTTLVPCTLKDISQGGMFIHMASPPPIGSRFSIEIGLRQTREHREVLELRAEVVRAVKVTPDPHNRTGVGVRLIDPPPYVDTLASLAGSLS